MHELSYGEGVLEAVERRAASRPAVAVEGGADVVLEWLEYADTTAERSPELVPPHTHVGGD